MNAALTINRKHANAAKAWRVAARVMGRTVTVLSRPMSECSRLESSTNPTFGFRGYQDCTSPGGAVDA